LEIRTCLGQLGQLEIYIIGNNVGKVFFLSA